MTESSIISAIGHTRVPTRFLLIGDSRAGNGHTISVGGTALAQARSLNHHQRGMISWFRALTNAPVEFLLVDFDGIEPASGHAVGVGGERSTDAMARFRRDVEKKINSNTCVIILEGTNDIKNAGGEITDADSLVHTLSWLSYNSLFAGACCVWTCNVDPRNNSDGKAFSAAQNAIRLDVNAKLIDALDHPLIDIIDLSRAGSDISGDLQLTNSYDGIHGTSRYAYTLTKEELIRLYKKWGGKEHNYRAVPPAYNATYAPYGNVLANPTFTGSGGTASTGVTGVVADGYTADRSTGSTITAVARRFEAPDWNGDDAGWQELLITSTGAGIAIEQMRLRHSATYVTTGLVADQWYRGSIEVTLPKGTPDGLVRSVYLEVRDEDGIADVFVRHFSTAYTDGSNKDLWPTDEMQLVLTTPPLQYTGGTGFTFYVFVAIDGTVVGSVPVQFSRPFLEPLPSLGGQLIPLGCGTYGAGSSTGVIIAEKGDEFNHVTEFTFINAPMSVTHAAGTDGFGSIHLYDFPLGYLFRRGANINLTFTDNVISGQNANIVDGSAFVFGLGTSVQSAAGTTLTSSSQYNMSTTANAVATLTSGVATAKDSGKIESTPIDGTSSARSAYLNIAGVDTTASGTLVVNGKITIHWTSIPN